MTSFVKDKKLGEIFVSPIDVILPNQVGTPVQPDILFIASGNLEIVTDKNIVGVPDLVVEVISASNWADDRRVKFNLYAEAGVREYWIVDPRQETIEVFTLGPNQRYELLDRYAAGDTIHSQVLADFLLAVSEIFPA